MPGKIKGYLDFNQVFSFIPIEGTVLKLEVCKNHYHGLIDRKIKGDGMLFKYNTPSPLNFHTKGCIVPLDIIFLLNGKVVQVFLNCKPNAPENFTCLSSDMVIELPAGECVKKGIKKGSTITNIL